MQRRNSRRSGALWAAQILLLSLLWMIAASTGEGPPRAQAEKITDSIAGKLLVATPELKDPRFVQTVIYMVTHNATGAFGFVINRPLAKGPIADLLKGFGIDSTGAKGEIVIHYGGPVATGQAFVIHSDEIVLDSSIKVKDGIAVTSDARLVQAIAHGKGPRQALFVLGYAGWGPGQLETEIKANSWYIVPGDKALIFGKDADKKWRRAIDRRQIPL